jgi:histidinol-phosphatase (PHP family)
MKKMIVDIHTHTHFSHDAQVSPTEMAEAAYQRGIAFYGISDHFDYDYDDALMSEEEFLNTRNGDAEEYFHTLRHLQEDYEGAMNVLVGAEFGFDADEAVQQKYLAVYEKFRPDFVINSIHSLGRRDYCRSALVGTKLQIYKEYLDRVRKSLEAKYPYDIVGHIGYVARYVDFEDASLAVKELQAQLDDIFLTIIRKNKILEVNTANKHLKNITLPEEALLKRYFDLGGRKISFGSDAHFCSRIADKWEEVTKLLKTIGFTHLTVPFRGEHIEVEL